MYIEDLLVHLHTNCKTNRFDKNIVESFVYQIMNGKSLSEKQAILAIKILNKYSNSLSTVLKTDIKIFIQTPDFKFPVKKNTNLRKLEIVSNPIYYRVIKLEFPFDKQKIDLIKSNKSRLNFYYWDSDQKSWIFSLTEANIQFVAEFVKGQNFILDPIFVDYLEQLKTTIENIEKLIPMLGIENNKPVIINKNQFIPELTSQGILEAIFEVRNYGILTYNEDIEKYLEDQNIDPMIKDLLNTDTAQILTIDSEKNPVQCLKEIVKYTNPILFVVPNYNQYNKTKTITDFLLTLGVDREEISVMFRLSNATDANFNNFVKTYGFNNQITNKTKFVFVSNKIVKPILSSEIRFNCLINLGKDMSHHSIREFSKNFHCRIRYSEIDTQTHFDFYNFV